MADLNTVHMTDVTCPCGRGPVIGICTWNTGRLFFRAFGGNPVAYDNAHADSWACVDCVADAAQRVGNGDVLRDAIREAEALRADDRVASARKGFRLVTATREESRS